MTEAEAAAVASCPLCRERFEAPADYKAHLAEIHALIDDAGTDTEAVVAPPPPPEPDPEPPAPPTKAEVKAEAKARLREAKEAKPARAPRAPREPTSPRPARARRPSLLSHLRLPVVDAGGRYPLALRYGDVALYAPGALLVLAGVAGRGSDAVSLTMAIFGAVLVMTGILLPIVHRRFFDAAEPAAAPALEAPAAPSATEASPVHQPEPAPAATPTLEEVLLSLPTER